MNRLNDHLVYIKIFIIHQMHYLNLPGPFTCFKRHKRQSTAAYANTNILSVPRNASKTSRTTLKWWTCSLSKPDSIKSVAVLGILTARRAPKRGLQPDLISVVQPSTNSHIELTIYIFKRQKIHIYIILANNIRI